MLPEELWELFGDETGRVYGLTSNYVHLTPIQIQERIAAVDAGRTAGKESATDIEGLNSLVSRGLAISLTLLFHSVPPYVAGDWLVESDGTSARWYFGASRFLAGIDSHFDYKNERQDRLTEILDRSSGRHSLLRSPVLFVGAYACEGIPPKTRFQTETFSIRVKCAKPVDDRTDQVSAISDLQNKSNPWLHPSRHTPRLPNLQLFQVIPPATSRAM